MCEVSLGHKVIGLDDSVNVAAVDTYSDTHNHVLWTFSDTSIDTEKVGALKSLESKAVIWSIGSVYEWTKGKQNGQVVIEIAVVDDRRIQQLRMFADYIVNFFRNHAGRATILGIN